MKKKPKLKKPLPMLVLPVTSVPTTGGRMGIVDANFRLVAVTRGFDSKKLAAIIVKALNGAKGK